MLGATLSMQRVKVKDRGEFTGVLGSPLSICIEGQRVKEDRGEFTGVLGATLSYIPPLSITLQP